MLGHLVVSLTRLESESKREAECQALLMEAKCVETHY